MLTRTALSCSLALILAGCAAVGPDYVVPDEAVIQRPGAAAPLINAQENTLYRQDDLPPYWWRLYQDPTLNALIEQALHANANLRIAAANLERAQALTHEAQAQQQPTFGVNASPYFGHVSGLQELQPDVSPPNRWSYSTGVSMSYQLDLAGQIRRAIEAGHADEHAAQAAYQATRVTIVAQTAGAYAGLCAAGMQLASAQHSVELQRESLAAVQQLQQAGRGTALDLSRAHAQLEQLHANLPPFEAQQRTALYRLAALTGHTPAELPADLLQCQTPPRLTQAIPVGDGATLLRRRPDVRQAERQLAAATARIGVATADLYPKITLGLSGASAGPAGMMGDKGTFSWSLGPLISWTLPNTGAVQSRIAQAQANAKSALAQFDATVLNALRETESALVVYAKQMDKEHFLQAALEQSTAAAHQAQTLFLHGKVDYLSVLDAQRTQAAAQSALAATQAELSADQITVFLALGGGWETPETATPSH